MSAELLPVGCDSIVCKLTALFHNIAKFQLIVLLLQQIWENASNDCKRSKELHLAVAYITKDIISHGITELQLQR